MMIKFFAALTLFSVSTVADDWPQYRGPTHDGTTSEKIGAWPASDPRALWRVPTPNGFSSFAVKDGRAFTLIAREVDGVEREVLIALDVASGKELWAAVFGPVKYGHDGGNAGARNNSGGDGPRSTPAVDGGRVYVITSDLLLACFDAASGKPVWRRDVMKEHNGRNIKWKNAASPLVEGELILMAGGGRGQALLGIDKNTGAVVWKGESEVMTHATPTPATIHGVRQVIFYTEKGLVAVRPADGTVLWRHAYPFSVSSAASPVVADNIVFCSAGYGVGGTAIEITRSGDRFRAEELWRVRGDKLANHWSTPVYKDGHLYGMFQFKEYGDGPLKCVELRTGKEKWARKGFGPGNVILVDNQLVVLGDAGQVVLVEPSPGEYKEKTRFEAVTGKCWSIPAYSNGVLYVRSTKEGAAFDLSRKVTQR